MLLSRYNAELAEAYCRRSATRSRASVIGFRSRSRRTRCAWRALPAAGDPAELRRSQSGADRCWTDPIGVCWPPSRSQVVNASTLGLCDRTGAHVPAPIPMRTSQSCPRPPARLHRAPVAVQEQSGRGCVAAQSPDAIRRPAATTDRRRQTAGILCCSPLSPDCRPPPPPSLSRPSPIPPRGPAINASSPLRVSRAIQPPKFPSEAQREIGHNHQRLWSSSRIHYGRSSSHLVCCVATCLPSWIGFRCNSGAYIIRIASNRPVSTSALRVE